MLSTTNALVEQWQLHQRRRNADIQHTIIKFREFFVAALRFRCEMLVAPVYWCIIRRSDTLAALCVFVRTSPMLIQLEWVETKIGYFSRWRPNLKRKEHHHRSPRLRVICHLGFSLVTTFNSSSDKRGALVPMRSACQDGQADLTQEYQWTQWYQPVSLDRNLSELTNISHMSVRPESPDPNER